MYCKDHFQQYQSYLSSSEGGTIMEQWLNMISDIGFPILVSFYLLHRVEMKLDAIHDALVSLK